MHPRLDIFIREQLCGVSAETILHSLMFQWFANVSNSLKVLLSKIKTVFIF